MYQLGKPVFESMEKFEKKAEKIETASKIWNFLIEKGYSETQAAAVLGNIEIEDGWSVNRMEDKYQKQLGLSDEEYTNLINSGKYSEDQFANDHVGYGLLQWTDPDLKREMYTMAIEQEKNIDDFDFQCEFLANYIEKLEENDPKKQFFSTDDPEAAGKSFGRYVNGNQEKTDRNTFEKRGQFAEDYYNKFAEENT